MNLTQKTKLKAHFTTYKQSLLHSFKINLGRSLEDKEANHLEMQALLKDVAQMVGAAEADIKAGAALFKEVLGKDLEVQKPPSDNGAARKLVALDRDSSDVRLTTLHNIDVRLDIDQLKHQHKDHPIGTRIKGGGNRFVSTCDVAWHQANTLVHMANWANGLGMMTQGQQTFHGQANAVDGIHYEGFCLMANGKKYVLFHCYPADNSPLKF